MKAKMKKDPPALRDLRVELITAGLAILEEEGLRGLTLRRVAARVGVSHAAPAHHFSGLPQLLGCICSVGFTRLSAAMEDGRRSAPRDPRSELVAIGSAYVEFGEKNPALVQLMFNTEPASVDDLQLRDAAFETYLILRDACSPFAPIGPQPDSTETLVWSLVHGLLMLKLGGRLENPKRQTHRPLFEDVLPELPLRRR